MNWDAATKRMKPITPGLMFYPDIIDAFRAKGIIPFLTSYHWDFPLPNVLLAHGPAVQRSRGPTAPEALDANAKIVHFSFGWFLQQPVVSGKYPAVMRDRVSDRLETLTEEETKLLVGSHDLFMLNHDGAKSIVDCASPQSAVQCDTQAIG